MESYVPCQTDIECLLTLRAVAAAADSGQSTEVEGHAVHVQGVCPSATRSPGAHVVTSLIMRHCATDILVSAEAQSVAADFTNRGEGWAVGWLAMF
eukprot:scaffold7793_cov41-Prasinocladus_malaysianus.AAC.1